MEIKIILKKLTSLLLIYLAVIAVNLPLAAQTENKSSDLQILKEKSQDGNLKDAFTKQTADSKFTKADAARLEKEDFKRQQKKNNLSAGAKIGIGLGIAAALILIIVVSTRGNDSTSTGPIQCGTIQAPCP